MDTSPIPSSEEQVMLIMQNLFQTQYALDKQDQDVVFRLMQYGKTMGGLKPEEMAALKERGLMDTEDNKLLILDLFYVNNSLVMPAFWLKCLLAIHKMVSFNLPPEEENPNENAPQ
jgi:hypothetical protein